ncbi:hypothetical protein HMPREF3156_01294 [Neisseria sp. HMSC06F02]|nr:hypothetical protein HMPREF3156_01294 [Neisseria sp. HMSC06F02]
MVEVHRALDGVAAQMQRADIAFFGNADFGQVRLGGAQAAVGVSWHDVDGWRGKGGYFIRVCGGLLVFAQIISNIKKRRNLLKTWISAFLCLEKKLHQLFHKTARECAVFC